MKLNLLPTYVGKEKAARSAILLSAVLAIAGIGASVFMITSSRDARRKSEEDMVSWQARAAAAVAESKKADLIVQNARVLILNTNLATAMNKHNFDYIDLYNTVRKYVPGFFRLTSMSAQPAGEDSVVTLQGVIQTQQQYADLMLALLRIPGAKSVTRSGYQIVEQIVPNLTEGSQNGRPIDRGSAPIPDDPLARMDQLMNQPRRDGFLNQGNFGLDAPTVAKGAMPDWSLITVSVVVPKNIQTPNPRATLASIGSATGNTAPGGTTPASGPPIGPGGPPGRGGPDTGDDTGR